jgi:plastocyanin
MDKKVTVEMTLAQYRDYLLLQVAWAAEEARRVQETLDAAHSRWEEALQLAKANGCTDEQLAQIAGSAAEQLAQIAGSAAEPRLDFDSSDRANPSQTPNPNQRDDGRPFKPSSIWDPVRSRVKPEWSALKISMHDTFFQPRDITVKLGDALVVSNLGTHTHNFSIEKTDVDVDVGPGESSTVELSALEPSTYTFVCADHREEGMAGTITLT